MNIKDFRKWVNSLPAEFDEYTLTHRDYYDTDGSELIANEIDIVSVHIDSDENKACLMDKQSYMIFKGDELITKLKVSSTKVEI